jgi:hypothetical protein
MAKPIILAPWQKEASLLILRSEEQSVLYCHDDIVYCQIAGQCEYRRVTNAWHLQARDVTEEVAWRANPEGKDSPIGWFDLWARWALHTGQEYNPDSWLDILEVEKWQPYQD